MVLGHAASGDAFGHFLGLKASSGGRPSCLPARPAREGPRQGLVTSVRPGPPGSVSEAARCSPHDATGCTYWPSHRLSSPRAALCRPSQPLGSLTRPTGPRSGAAAGDGTPATRFGRQEWPVERRPGRRPAGGGAQSEATLRSGLWATADRWPLPGPRWLRGAAQGSTEPPPPREALPLCPQGLGPSLHTGARVPGRTTPASLPLPGLSASEPWLAGVCSGRLRPGAGPFPPSYGDICTRTTRPGRPSGPPEHSSGSGPCAQRYRAVGGRFWGLCGRLSQ